MFLKMSPMFTIMTDRISRIVIFQKIRIIALATFFKVDQIFITVADF